MVKLVALWTAPNDPEAFDREYVADHLPMVPKVPGITRAVGSKVLQGSYYRMAELFADSAEAMQSALQSPEGRDLVAHADHLQEKYGNRLDVLIVDEQNQM